MCSRRIRVGVNVRGHDLMSNVTGVSPGYGGWRNPITIVGWGSNNNNLTPKKIIRYRETNNKNNREHKLIYIVIN